MKIPLVMLTGCSGIDLVSWLDRVILVLVTDDQTKQLAADPFLSLSELQAAI